MPSAAPSPSSASPAPSNSSRSLLSRIKTPFAAKPRNIFEFDIQPDDPHRQYTSGDVVTGTVILKVIKPVRITHLAISLHGYVQVFKNPNTQGESWRAHQSTPSAGKGKRTGSGYMGNGFASLFEDEHVLCGEGRLSEGIYHFNFELVFPQKRLPSSIDFERGTVSYLITATLTRPTTINPTTTCDRKIYLIENIDIAPLFEPKPRVISLEPKPGRARVRAAKKRPPNGDSKSSDSPDTSDQAKSRMSELSSVDENEVPGSPAPSDGSFETQMSVTTGSVDEVAQLSIGTPDGSTRSKHTLSGSSISKKAITSRIELLKGGFLRGDHVPLKITVNHTKYIKSLHGIIVTLYRRATVDMHPALPVVKKDERSGREDYMPRSRTGLGGLSLSSSGSSHTFRKDLAQSFAPLIIDPRTLSAEVKVSVRVPDEAFPTISSVPGAMISFRYYVEVVVDLQGKLAGLGRYLPNSGMLSVPSGYGNNVSTQGRAEDASGTVISAWGANFLDTSQIRRDKTVVACLFEVIVGTKDSERKNKGKARDESALPIDESGRNVQEIQLSVGGTPQPQEQEREYFEYENYENYENYDHYHPDDAIQQHDHYYDNSYAYDQQQYPGPQYGPQYPPPGFPVPAPIDTSALSEKERIRLLESRLLPSAPPTEADGSSFPATAAALTISAPSLSAASNATALVPSESDVQPIPLAPSSPLPGPYPASNHDRPPSAGPSAPPHAVPSAPSAPSGTPPPPLDTFSDALPRASLVPVPAYEIHAQSHETRIEAGPEARSEDKEEVRRRELEAGRSAPPGEDAEESSSRTAPVVVPANGVRSGGEQGPEAMPSAPSLEDVEGREVGEGLPRYER